MTCAFVNWPFIEFKVIMGKACSAYGCTKRCKKGEHFYRFPMKNKELLDKWVIAMKRTNFTPESILSTFLHDVNMIPGIFQACKQHFFV